jgi:hypothetical protein
VRPILGRDPNEVKKGIKTVAHLVFAASGVFSGFRPSHGLTGGYFGPEVLVLYRKRAFSEVDDRRRLFWRAFDKAT